MIAAVIYTQNQMHNTYMLNPQNEWWSVLEYSYTWRSWDREICILFDSLLLPLSHSLIPCVCVYVCLFLFAVISFYAEYVYNV